MKKKHFLTLLTAICLLLINSLPVIADGGTPIANRSGNITGYIYDALGNIIGYIFG